MHFQSTSRALILLEKLLNQLSFYLYDCLNKQKWCSNYFKRFLLCIFWSTSRVLIISEDHLNQSTTVFVLYVWINDYYAIWWYILYWQYCNYVFICTCIYVVLTHIRACKWVCLCVHVTVCGCMYNLHMCSVYEHTCACIMDFTNRLTS